jgi:hypothetical protein
VAIALNRYEAIDFCGMIGGDYSTLLVRYPAATVSFTSAYDVFSKEVYRLISNYINNLLCRLNLCKFTISFPFALNILIWDTYCERTQIWIGLLTSLVVIVGVSKVIICIDKRLFQSELIRQLTMKSGDVAWYMFSTIISQGRPILNFMWHEFN